LETENQNEDKYTSGLMTVRRTARRRQAEAAEEAPAKQHLRMKEGEYYVIIVIVVFLLRLIFCTRNNTLSSVLFRLHLQAQSYM
jgi:uncharacterized integral membrane protein